jgi:hypothetical protein
MEVKFSNNGEMDIVEITRPDGSVVALPAEQSNSDGQRYCDVFQSQYEAFKSPEPTAEEAKETGVEPVEPVKEPA